MNVPKLFLEISQKFAVKGYLKGKPISKFL